MPTWLNVAEKPSVAKQIQLTLSNGRSETIRSCSRFNPVFEFTYRGNITMLVTSVAGHVTEEDFTGPAKSWSGFPLRELFTVPITKVIRDNVKDIKQNIEFLMRRADTLVLWLDCDREGENICFEVIEIARNAAKRNFSVKRAHFSALTQRDIQFAIDRLREPDARLSEAVEARKEMDLRIGAAFTRFQTLRLRDVIPGVVGVTSFGTCQFPALGFVVRREWERFGFEPEDFFTLRLHHGNTTFTSVRGAIFDQVAATLIYEDLLLRASWGVSSLEIEEMSIEKCEGDERSETVNVNRAEVVDVRQYRNHRRPPFPLSTVMMQKLAATNLHISSEKSMQLAESLYQDGYLSYPRTETNHFKFTKDELLDLVRLQTGNAEVGSFAENMLQDTNTRFCTPLNGGQDDKAHPPIHPTKLYNPSSSSSNPGEVEKLKLYQLIVRHFFACLSPPAVEAQTTVTIAYGGEEFSTRGSTVVSPGWTEIFPYAQRGSTTIPNYQLHETFVPSSVLLDKSTTSPPPRLTETALISAMDENGIGTDATIAQHIKTLIDRQYVKRVGQSMEPTLLGMALAAAYDVLGLSSLLQPQLRAQMEAAMGDVAAGKATKKDVVNASVFFYKEVFDRLLAREKDFLQVVHHFMQQRDGVDSSLPIRLIRGGEGDGCRQGEAEVSCSSHIRGAALSTNPINMIFLSDVHTIDRCFGQCGRCQNALSLVESKQDIPRHFLQCFHCTLQFRLPNFRYADITVLSPAVMCPICQFSVLQAENRERHTKYTFCPHCFQHPPPPSSNLSADIENTGVTDFRCMHCLHPSCSLAKGREQISITKCISCKTSDLRLRQSAAGASYILSCSGYPSCAFRIGLPKASRIEVVMPPQRCGHCHARMLCFDFRGVQPVPGLEEVEVACVQCDIRLKEYLVVLNPGSTPGSGRGGESGDIANSLEQEVSRRSTHPYTLPSIESLACEGGRRGQTNVGRGRGVGNNAVSTVAGASYCACGAPAKQLISRKPNSYGKAFRTCAMRKCGFFEWCE